MNLTITLTDEQFSVIKEALLISKKHYNDAAFGRNESAECDYATRILQCRKALGLSTSQFESCFDSGPLSLDIDTGVSLGQST